MRMVVSIAPHPGHGAGEPGVTCGCEGARRCTLVASAVSVHISVPVCKRLSMPRCAQLV